ncbi:MAG: OprD family outer membrane porin, partial [Endozoicomonas sp.]
TGLLPVKEDGDSFSYGKTTYAIKVNLNGMGVVKYGRLLLETPLLNDSDSRSLPSLTEAFYAEGTLDALSLYAILATKNNPRSESGFDNMMVNGSKKAVKVAGGNYDFGNGLNTHVAIGQQDDYARRAYVHLDYARDIVDMDGYSVNAGLVYGNNDRIGVSKQADEDNSQKTWGITLGATLEQASFGIRYQSISQTDIDYFDAGWSVGEDGDSDNTEYYGPNAMMIRDFNANGQKSWGFSAGYDFTGMVDGLNLSAAYVMGDQDPKGENNDTDEKEYNLMASYTLPQMEGLNLAAQYGKNTEKPEGGTDRETTEVRFIVKYDMSAF